VLKELLGLIASGAPRTHEELAEALDVPLPMVAQMTEQLAREGYLVAVGACDEGCNSCALKSMCGPQQTLHLWTLTEKGRAALA
jgi:hypothetical protein